MRKIKDGLRSGFAFNLYRRVGSDRPRAGAVFREARAPPIRTHVHDRSFFPFGGECDDSRGTGCPDSFFIVRPSPTLFYRLAARHEG